MDLMPSNLIRIPRDRRSGGRAEEIVAERAAGAGFKSRTSGALLFRGRTRLLTRSITIERLRRSF